MKILYKLVFAFVLMTLLLGAIGYISLKNTTNSYELYLSASEKILPAIISLNQIKQSAAGVFSATFEYKLFAMQNNASEESKVHELEEISENKEIYLKSFDEYGAIVESYFPEEKTTRDNIQEKWRLFINKSDELMRLNVNPSADKSLSEQYDEFYIIKKDLFDVIDSVISRKNQEIALIQEDVKKTNENSLNSFLIIIWFFVLVSIGGVMIAYKISNSVMKLRDVTELVGRGNLDTRVEVVSKDEVGELAKAFNLMIADLKKSKFDVEERENALNQKIAELTKTKAAMMNMMEDGEELNAALVNAQTHLKRNLKELKESDIKKNQFMSVAAHEFKTPLTSIHGFSQLLESNSILKDAEKRNKFLKIIENETERLAKLVNEVLDISRIDLDAMKFSFEKINLSELMDHVMEEMSIQIEDNGLIAEYSVERNLPYIVTDREKLTQVLINLITNAVKYTPKGKITVKAFAENDNVHFFVQDTGVGIVKSHHDKIFTRFYQEDSSATRRAGGVGLGLALSKEFVELLGGRIWFESKVGVGSTFHFTMPVHHNENTSKGFKNRSEMI